MAAKRRRSNFLNQEGQALIEFILFLPFILMLYSVVLSIANALNASINQQKVTRSYFYYRLQNNSTAPTPFRGEENTSFTRFGSHINIWGERQIGETPVAACYKFSLPLGELQGDDCENTYDSRSTQYIRVGTVYGICGASYVMMGTPYPVRLPNSALGNSFDARFVVDQNSCNLLN